MIGVAFLVFGLLYFVYNLASSDFLHSEIEKGHISDVLSFIYYFTTYVNRVIYIVLFFYVIFTVSHFIVGGETVIKELRVMCNNENFSLVCLLVLLINAYATFSINEVVEMKRKKKKN